MAGVSKMAHLSSRCGLAAVAVVLAVASCGKDQSPTASCVGWPTVAVRLTPAAGSALTKGQQLVFETEVDYAVDEGTPAHIFQLLMAAQVPVVAFFAIKWLPRAPGQTLRVLALQAGAAIAAIAAVVFLT